MFISTKKLKALRQSKGWSQELLAKMSGLSVRTIQRVESDGKASAETVLSIASVFELSPNELQSTSNEIEVNWSRKQIMKSLFIFILLVATVTTAIGFGHPNDFYFYVNIPSIAFVFLFTYFATIIAFGTNGAAKSVTCLRYLFTDEMVGGAKAHFIATILNAQIKFCYASAFLGMIIGSVGIHSNYDAEGFSLHYVWAINLLTLFWATVFSEVILRPLKTKMSTCDMAQ
ncbi:helix-turn-helix domain-containing protein [Alteromonas facilis]|uniref:helix-turn-helix domain-containing protein n=1 Tax=Alteromonas facilis TaxID=2048004 RepID=UPI000C293627|nr:helix-turn-helix transcriptional regulator [Alteromonas facilis]